MNFLKKISPEWALRIGFAATYFYSGFSILSDPGGWAWAVPGWFSNLVLPFFTIETYLQIQALGEIAFAIFFLLWFVSPKFLGYVAALAALEMAGILFLGNTGINLVTFRDLGLLGGLISLFLIFQTQSGKKI